MLPPKLTHVEALSNYRLHVQFSNGELGELDVTPYLDFGVFSRLKNPDHFAQARINFDTVEWPCGVDLDPSFVYQKSSRALKIAQPITFGDSPQATHP